MKPDPQSFSDDDADQFADAFKPAWDAPDLEATAVSAPPSAVAEHKEEQAAVSSTLVMDRPSDWDVAEPIAPVAAAPSIAEAPTEKAPVATNMKRTMIGMAVPPAPPPPPPPLSAEITATEVARPAGKLTEPDPMVASAPANLPFSSATSSPNVASIASGGAPKYTMGMGTQLMSNRPLPPTPAPAAVATIASLPGSAGYQPSRPPQAPVSADPFRSRAGSSSDFEVKPRKSNKAIVIGVIGVMALIGLGVGLKAMISDDAADKPKSEPIVTGPAVTTAEIPPPPPPSEPATANTAAAAKTAEPTSTTTTAAATALPTPLPPPQQHAAQPVAPPPAMAAAQPRNDPPRKGMSSPPPAPPPAAAKTPTKSANGGIVRDNPF